MPDSDVRIAAVDDDPHLRALVELALETAGFDVTLYASGAEALQDLPARNVDLVLLDVVMPDMDGYQTLARMHADPSLRDMRVAFLTGKSAPSDIAACLAAGAAAVLAKPIILSTFAEQVRSVLTETRPLRSHA